MKRYKVWTYYLYDDLNKYVNYVKISRAKKKPNQTAGAPRQGSPTPGGVDPSKYSRAYLSLVKAGEVMSKRNKFEQADGQNYRSLSPTARAVGTYSMPEINLDYIAQHMTDLTRPVIKAQEVGDIKNVRRRLEDRNSNFQEMAGQSFNQSKAKLKHICKKVGHSKILGKMVALQCSSQTELDQGTVKLFEKAKVEDEYLNVYKSGEVENRVSQFEKIVTDEQPRTKSPNRLAKFAELEPNGVSNPIFSELDDRYPFEPEPNFSWSRRFDTCLPQPSESYSTAQRHNQFRNYYGYLPSQVKAPELMGVGDIETRIGQRVKAPIRDRRAMYENPNEIVYQPTSLPATLDRIPESSDRKKGNQEIWKWKRVTII